VVLNLIPLPPFDGFWAIEPHLSYDLRMRLLPLSGMLGLVVLMVLWWMPFASQGFWRLVGWLTHVAGVPLGLATTGLRQFMFWQ
jgi:Zn-dependent protease